MFSTHAVDADVSTHDILAELRLPQAVVVRAINPADPDLAPAFRSAIIGGSDPDCVLLPSRERAESWIRGILRSAIERSGSGEARAAALAPDVSLRTMLRALDGVPREVKREIAEHLARVDGADAETRTFIDTKFDNVAAHLSTDERILLACKLMAAGESAGIARVLKASGSLAELSRLVDALGSDTLAGRSSEIRECVALAVLLPALHKIPLGADDSDVTRSSEDLRRGFSEALRVCLARPDLADTRFGCEMQRTIVDDLVSLDHDLARAQTDAERRAVIAIARRAAQIEFRYGVDITTGPGEDLITHPRAEADPLVWPDPRPGEAPPTRWRLKDMEEIERILGGLHEGRLVLTDRIHRIEFVDSLGQNVLGARYHDDGRIKIAAVALDHAGISAAVHNVSSLVFVLTHELGHSFQIGGGEGGFTVDGGRFDFAPGEASIDFREFATLSGWQVIDPSRVSFGSRDGVTVLDGREVPLGRPVLHGGRWIVLFGESTSLLLVSVDATAEFSARWYSRTSPWEDFAEAFAYYYACPEALIMDAPFKFIHLDEELRRYTGDERITQLLDTSLRLRGKVR